jgi:hypothetical protein
MMPQTSPKFSGSSISREKDFLVTDEFVTIKFYKTKPLLLSKMGAKNWI